MFSLVSGGINNFPYNISSQILFKIIEIISIFQKWWECFPKVAEITATFPEPKIMAFCRFWFKAYYDVKYLFTVHENVLIHLKN